MSRHDFDPIPKFLKRVINRGSVFMASSAALGATTALLPDSKVSAQTPDKPYTVILKNSLFNDPGRIQFINIPPGLNSVRQTEDASPAEPGVPLVVPAAETKIADESASAQVINEPKKPGEEAQAEAPKPATEAVPGTESVGAGNEIQQVKEKILTERTKIDLDNPETWRVEIPDGYGGEPFAIRITESSAPGENIEAVRQNTYSIGESRNLQPDVQHVGIFFQVGEGFPERYKFSLIGYDPNGSNGKGLISWQQPYGRTVAVGFEPYEQSPVNYRRFTQPVHPRFNSYILALFNPGGKLAYTAMVIIGEGSIPELKPAIISTIERAGPELKNR